jgi:ADP-ribose pyrophosphatase
VLKIVFSTFFFYGDRQSNRKKMEGIEMLDKQTSNKQAENNELQKDSSNKKECRLNRTLAYKGAILNIYKDHILFPDGHTADYDYIHHKGAAAVLPVMDDGRILMVRQYRNALDRYTLEIPAGALDEEGEPGIHCASRELEEETGYRAGKIEWMMTLRTTVAFCDERIEVFLAQDLIPSVRNLDPEENIEIEAHSLKELKEMVFRGEIEDSKTVSAIMAYNAKIQ